MPTQDTVADKLNERRDDRLLQLTNWTRKAVNVDDLQVSVASADASFRRYFRAQSGSQSWVVMDAPPEKENIGPYIAVARMLVAAGVNAPKILAENLEQGFLLLTDLGNRTYLTELSNSSQVDRLYHDALIALVRMQAGCEPHARELPPYDAALLRREMELFPEWLVGRHLGMSLDATRCAELEKSFEILIESALAQPRIFVHRDYHSRNLMVTEGVHGPNPGVLDFQDAVHGPITYDLVSLLRDCYISWPLERVHGWARAYLSLAKSAKIDVGLSETQFMRQFDLMGVQRHLKASGIFARLWHRDGKPGYLNDIPRTLNYIRTVLSAYPELQPLESLVSRVLSALEKR